MRTTRKGLSCHWLPVLSRWSLAVILQTLGLTLYTTRYDCSCLCGLLLSTRWWTLIPSSEVWSDQAFSCMGMSRSRDVYSKCAGVLWSYFSMMKIDEMSRLLSACWYENFWVFFSSGLSCLRSSCCHHVTRFCCVLSLFNLCFLLLSGSVDR